MGENVLRHKAISGFQWSFARNFVNQGSNFLVGIVLARLLSPKEFGLIGMLAIFIAVSQAFINCGFTEALIRKNNSSQDDYCTVFYFNLAAAIVLYIVLFLSAAAISRFFNEPLLIPLIRALSSVLVISSIGMVQLTILKKKVDFKLQTKITFFAAVFSGIVSISMAFFGWGVWSLIWKILLFQLIMSLLLWVWNDWRPKLLFSLASFRELFNFGSKLFLSSVIYKVYYNIYYAVIGKFFSATMLGYYTYAYNLSHFPPQNIEIVVQQVSYPIFSSIQDDLERFKRGYKRVMRNTMFISFMLMMGIAASAKPLVLTLIGEKWLPTVPYLRLLCFVGMIYPLHALNLDVLKIKKRSDLFLTIEIAKILLAIPVIVLGIFFGIKIMIIGMILFSIVAYFINSFWTGKFIRYSSKEQIVDMMPLFISALGVGIILFSIGYFWQGYPAAVLCVQVLIGFLCAILIAKFIKMDFYEEIEKKVILKIWRR
ncbi:MAG: lipopolysaccharide biosynthesis protein [Candidatus Omnitrophica bacterium]|nr:lipopolysaccharide biosynthesis protein [Candidatus Omnitrophota bacterium]